MHVELFLFLKLACCRGHLMKSEIEKLVNLAFPVCALISVNINCKGTLLASIHTPEKNKVRDFVSYVLILEEEGETRIPREKSSPHRRNQLRKLIYT